MDIRFHALRRRAVPLLAGGLLVSLAACGGSANGGAGGDAAAGPSVSINMGHVFPDGSQIDLAADKFAADVAKRTGGTVKVNVFPGGQIGSDEEMATALRSGTQEAAVLSVGSTGFGNRVQLQNLPYLVSSYEAADKFFYGDGFMAKWDRETMKQNNIVALEFVENGFRGLSNSKRPITSPADVAGLKVRAPSSDVIIKVFSGWKAHAVAIPFPELYTALEQGTVDGQENGVTLFHDSKLYEVQKYYTDTRYTYATAAIVVSKGTWDKLNPKQQEVLQAAAQEASLAQRKAVRATVAAALTDMKAKIKVTELTDAQFEEWRASVQHIYKEAEGRFGAGVLAEVQDAAKKASS